MKGQLVCQRQSAFGLSAEGVFTVILKKESPIGEWGKITMSSFDSTCLGTWLDHPISDISPNTSLLGTFPFQPQSVVPAAFQGKIPRSQRISHNTESQWTKKLFAESLLKMWGKGFKICAFVMPTGEKVLQQTRCPSCILCVQYLMLQHRIPAQATVRNALP